MDLWSRFQLPGFSPPLNNHLFNAEPQFPDGEQTVVTHVKSVLLFKTSVCLCCVHSVSQVGGFQPSCKAVVVLSSTQISVTAVSLVTIHNHKALQTGIFDWKYVHFILVLRIRLLQEFIFAIFPQILN